MRARHKDKVHSMDAVALLKSLPKNTVGAIITDPPFIVPTSEDWRPDHSIVDDAVAWASPLASEMMRVLRPGGAAVVMGGSQGMSAWEVAAIRAGLTWMAEITILWNTGKPRSRNFGSLSTSVRWYAKPGASHVFNSGEKRSIFSNVIVCQKVPLELRIHPAQKPVELTNFLVSLLTRDGDLIVDPFAGSGSTLVSAAMCEREWLGGDIDEHYAKLAERRALHPDLEPDLAPLYLWLNNKLVLVEG